jgi:hypothetical protein
MIALVLISVSGISQNVAINTTLNPANPAAGLDIDFPAKGFLIPRMDLETVNSADPLASHVAGMMIYCKGEEAPAGVYVNNGSKWVPGTKPGTAYGEMQYWNGTTWTAITAGSPGQFLKIGTGGLPEWSGSAAGYATLSTGSVTGITTTTAYSGGNISSGGGSSVTEYGVCWSTSPGPTMSNSKTSDGTGTGSFTSHLTGLTSGTQYYIRAYATNGTGTSYGDQKIFTTH